MTTPPARIVSANRVIQAPAAAIFAVVANPARHREFDGSGTVGVAGDQPGPLTLGATFTVAMKFGPLPYRITNTVVEYEPDRLLAWHHFGKHRWRFELEPRGDDTLVTESFDYSTAVIPKLIELVGYPARHAANIDRSLDRLAAAVE